MTTETQSIEDMLDRSEQAAAETPAQAPQTGVTDSAAPPADATPAQSRDDGPLVPRKALEDERRKRQDLEKRMEEFEARIRPAPQQQAPQQQMPAMPDPYTDPEGYAQWVTWAAVQQANAYAMRQAETVITNRELNRSETRAIKEHGQEAVDAAFNAAVQVGVARQFTSADDPYAEMMDWYKSYQVAANPDQYRAQIEAEILAKHGITPQAQPQAQPKSRAPVPRSLASTASAIPRDERGRFSGPTPLEDLIP